MWYYSIGTSINGPFEQAALTQMVQRGFITADSMVWQEGTAGWVRVGDSPFAMALNARSVPAAPVAVLGEVAAAVPARLVPVPPVAVGSTVQPSAPESSWGAKPVPSPSPIALHSAPPSAPLPGSPFGDSPFPTAPPASPASPAGSPFGDSPFAGAPAASPAIAAVPGFAPLVDRALPPPTPCANYYGPASRPDGPESSHDVSVPSGAPAPYGSRSANAYAPPRSSVGSTYLAKDPSLGWMQILFSFEGRIPRRQYWGAHFLIIGGIFLLGMGSAILVPLFGQGASPRPLAGSPAAARPGDPSIVPVLVMLLVSLPLIWTSLALSAKRWHDRGKSGFMVLVGFIPLIGPLWTFIECGLLRGTQGRNQYGSDPT